MLRAVLFKTTSQVVPRVKFSTNFFQNSFLWFSLGVQKSDYRFTEDHEWMTKPDSEGQSFVGISNYAQDQLGDVTHCELPEEGDSFDSDDTFGSVESVKMASDLYCPVKATIISINNNITSNPGLINSSPEDNGWMLKIKVDNTNEWNNLMERKEYENKFPVIEH